MPVATTAPATPAPAVDVNHVLQQIALLATGNATSAAGLEYLHSIAFADPALGTLVATVNGFMGYQASVRGTASVLQGLAHDALGMALSPSQAAELALYIDSGSHSWADLFALCIGNADTLGLTLGHRADAAQSFLGLLEGSGKAGFFDGSAVYAAVKNLLQGVDASAASTAQAKATLAALSANLQASGIQGTVVDGYLAGATVFVDANGDGRLNAGEWSTTTDGQGGYLLLSNAPAGKLIALGGTDLMTGQAFSGVLSAPLGSTYITPLTTLAQALLQNGQAGSAQEAAALVEQALGLSLAPSLLNYDPLAVLANAGASAADKATALAVQGAAVQVANVIALVGGAIRADAGSTDTLLDAGNAVIAALAAQVGTGARLDLADLAQVKAIAQTATSAMGSAYGASVIQDLAQITAASNAAAGNAQSITALAQSAVVAQGSALAAVLAGVNAGSLGAAVSGFTGAALDSKIGKAETGWINADVPVPSAPVPPAPVNPGGGGGSPAAPTFTATVVDGVVTFSGTATGDIDVSISGDGTATFVRGGITASTTVASVTGKTIQLATGQTLALNSADATGLVGVYFTGAGTFKGTEAFSVDQFSALEFDDDWTGTQTYSLSDSLANLLANLQAASDIVSGASSYTLTDTTLAGLTAAQILLVKGASNAASYDLAPPTFTSVTLDGAKIILTFSENIAVGTGNIVIKKVSDNSIAETIAVGDAQVSFNGKAIAIQPTALLAKGTDYYIEMGEGAVKDTFGNPFAGISGAATTSNFTAPPSFEVNVDANGTVNFSGTATQSITFTLAGTVATFEREGIKATTAVDFSATPTKTIALLSEQVLIANGADISGKAVSGDGAVAVLGLEATTDLSQLASTLQVLAVINRTTDLSANASLAGVKQYFVLQDDPQEVVTLTLTAAQASGASIGGYGNVTITGSDGAQTLDIQTYNTISVTSTSHITAGQGGDAIALGDAKDTVHIAGGIAGATESAAVTFQAMEAGDAITVAGQIFTATESISAENVAVQFASLGTNQLTGFTSAAAQGAAVTFTSTTPNDNVTNIGLTSSSAKTAHTPAVVTTEGASAASFVTVVTAQGVPGPADTSVVVHQGAALPEPGGFSLGDGSTTTSKHFLYAKELFSGQSLSIAGLTLTATADMTREEVASAFGGLTVGSTVGKAPVKGKWSGELAGYQTLAYTSGSQITVATLAPSSELIDINNLGLQATGPTENSVVTFGAMSAGQVLSVGGLTLSATGDIAAADVATAFASLSAGDSGGAGINGTWQGALSAFTSAAAVGDTVTFTSTTANGNVTDLPVLSGRTETTTVTFKDLAAGQSITVGGLTLTLALTATNNIEAWQVANEFNNLVAGTTGSYKQIQSYVNGTWSGTLTGFTSKNEGDSGGYGPSSTTVTFTSTTLGQNVTDLVVTGTDTGSGTGTASTETANVTFQALTNGDSITVAGLTLTATDNVSAEDAAAGFASLQAGASSGNAVANATWSGSALTGFNAGTAAGAVVVFTSTTPDKNVENIAISSARDTSAFAPAVVTTDGKPSGPSDSYFLNGDDSTMDTIVNFSLANDTLALPSKDIWAPSGTVGTGTVTINGGIATFSDSSAELGPKIGDLFYALGTNKAAVAFVDGGNTYVLYGDGVQGAQSSDIVVKLTGVEATSLATAVAAGALVLV